MKSMPSVNGGKLRSLLWPLLPRSERGLLQEGPEAGNTVRTGLSTQENKRQVVIGGRGRVTLSR